MRDLTKLEQGVIDKLLEGDHAVLTTLREQVGRARLTKRENTGVGFYCDIEVASELQPLEEIFTWVTFRRKYLA